MTSAPASTRYAVLVVDRDPDRCGPECPPPGGRDHLHLVSGENETFALTSVTVGATIRVVRGRKVAHGTEGRVAWLGQRPVWGGDEDRGPFEARAGIAVSDGTPLVYVKADYLERIAAAPVRTVTCEKCAASFTDSADAGAYAQLAAHRREAHPRPSGPRVDESGGVLYDGAGRAVWATCPMHGLVAPRTVVWDGRERSENGWRDATYRIAVAERVLLPRADDTESTVAADRTFCGTCGAPSVLRVIKLRAPISAEKAAARAAKRAAKNAERRVYCNGACLAGRISCDCFCGGMCHGAALKGLELALQREGLRGMLAAAEAAGDTAAAAHARESMTRLSYPCPGHPYEDVRWFYGAAE